MFFEVQLGRHGGDKRGKERFLARVGPQNGRKHSVQGGFGKQVLKNQGFYLYFTKTFDGKCDGYMWGLGGAEKRKC